MLGWASEKSQGSRSLAGLPSGARDKIENHFYPQITQMASDFKTKTKDFDFALICVNLRNLRIDRF